MCVKLYSLESLVFLYDLIFVFLLKELIDLKMVQCERVVNSESFCTFSHFQHTKMFLSSSFYFLKFCVVKKNIEGCVLGLFLWQTSWRQWTL